MIRNRACIKVKYTLFQVLAKLGTVKCPICNNGKVDVVLIKRPMEQSDGFQGIVCRCRACGNRWPVERHGPVL